jgi:phosphohistidine phosphatase SixA
VKALELRRHAERDPEEDRLSPRGRVHAEDVGRALPASYDAAFVSSAKRAAETLAWFFRGFGHPLPKNHAVFEPFRAPESPPELAAAVRTMFELIPEGGRGIAVGHTPLIEQAVQELTGQTVAPLAECEGVLLVEEGGAYRVDEEYREPPRADRGA